MDDNLTFLVLATGALGTAAFGIVEGLKRWRLVGESGFTVIATALGELWITLRTAYGEDAADLVRAKYRGEHTELARVLRQGARVGLTPANAGRVARALGIVEPGQLVAAAEAVQTGEELPMELRNILGRYELAVDTRIEAALTLAQDRYRRTMTLLAGLVAVTIALTVGVFEDGLTWTRATLIGIAAVPLAPVAKDVVGAIKAASEALGRRA